jgi:hypothetical protein
MRPHEYREMYESCRACFREVLARAEAAEAKVAEVERDRERWRDDALTQARDRAAMESKLAQVERERDEAREQAEGCTCTFGLPAIDEDGCCASCGADVNHRLVAFQEGYEAAGGEPVREKALRGALERVEYRPDGFCSNPQCKGVTAQDAISPYVHGHSADCFIAAALASGRGGKEEG